MARENGNSNTAIVAIVVILVIIVGIIMYYWGGFRDKGDRTSVNQTNVERPQGGGTQWGDRPGSGAGQTQPSPRP